MATIKLFESWLKEQIGPLNELAPHGKLDLRLLDAGTYVDDSGAVLKGDEITNLLYERVKTLLNRNGIKFSVSAERAAQILTAHYLNIVTPLGIKGGIDSWITKTSDLKLMDFPEDPNLVLTTGKFLEDEIQEPADDSQGSEYEQIALYCNNAALIQIREHLYKRANYSNVSPLTINVGYELSTNPDTGTLQWTRVAGKFAKFYGTKVTSSAVSKQTLAKTVWEVPAEGKTIIKQLPGTMFATGEVTISDSKELDAAILELKALLTDKNTKLTQIEIQSSASGDRPAADGKTGYPANTPAGKYPLGKPYLPKSAAESANAKLAFGRGATLQTKLATLGVPTKVVAQIQDGGDAAQFAKLIVSVEKVVAPGKTLTREELTTILSKPKQETGLASSKVLTMWQCQTGYQ